MPHANCRARQARSHGKGAALRVARERRGTWFDPSLVDIVVGWRNDDAWWREPRTERLNDTVLTLIFRAGPLHDIGKLGASSRILEKDGPLDKDEWAEIMHHPT